MGRKIFAASMLAKMSDQASVLAVSSFLITTAVSMQTGMPRTIADLAWCPVLLSQDVNSLLALMAVRTTVGMGGQASALTWCLEPPPLAVSSLLMSTAVSMQAGTSRRVEGEGWCRLIRPPSARTYQSQCKYSRSRSPWRSGRWRRLQAAAQR